MIKINGEALPAPTSFDVNYEDIDKADRNARGTMIKERIRTNVRKIELSWLYLSKSELKQISNLVSSSFFQVEHPDPDTGEMRTGTFYAGSRNIQGLGFYKGEMWWKGIKFNIIER